MDNFVEQVYDTLQGLLTEEYRIPDVENAFAAGRVCEKRYGDMLSAYARLCARLGKTEDEDEDVEIIINSLLDIGRELGCLMYKYGTQFGSQVEQISIFQQNHPENILKT